MTGRELSRAYLAKVRLRMEVLRLLAERRGWSDVVWEAQELVELACKAMLREVGVDPPRLHDVGPVLLAEQSRFPPVLLDRIPPLAEESQWLCSQGELAFCGDGEWIPTERYGAAEGQRALTAADLALELKLSPAGTARRVPG